MRTAYYPMFYFEVVKEEYDGILWLVEYIVYYTGKREIVSAVEVDGVEQNG